MAIDKWGNPINEPVNPTVSSTSSKVDKWGNPISSSSPFIPTEEQKVENYNRMIANQKAAGLTPTPIPKPVQPTIISPKAPEIASTASKTDKWGNPISSSSTSAAIPSITNPPKIVESSIGVPTKYQTYTTKNGKLVPVTTSYEDRMKQVYGEKPLIDKAGQLAMDWGKWISPQTLIAGSFLAGTPAGETKEDLVKTGLPGKSETSDTTDYYNKQMVDLGSELALQKGATYLLSKLPTVYRALTNNTDDVITGPGGIVTPSAEKVIKPPTNEEIAKVKLPKDWSESINTIATVLEKDFNNKVPVAVVNRKAKALLYAITKERPGGAAVATQAADNTLVYLNTLKQLGKTAPENLKSTLVDTLTHELKLGIASEDVIVPKPDMGSIEYLWSLVGRRSSETLKSMGASGSEALKMVNSADKFGNIWSGNGVSAALNIMKGMDQSARFAMRDLLEGKITKEEASKVSPIAVKAAGRMRKVLDFYSKLAQELKVKTAPLGTEPGIPPVKLDFKPRENFFPHVHDLSTLEKQATRLEIANKMVETGQAKNVKSALDAVNNYTNLLRTKKAPSIENHRMADLPGWIQDPLEAIPRYINSVSTRLANIKYMGQDGEKISMLLDDIQRTGGEGRAKLAQSIIERQLHPIQGASEIQRSKIYAPLKAFQVITKMTYSAIANSTQKINILLERGAPDFWYAIKNYKSPEAKEFAKRAGSIMDDTMSEIWEQKMGAGGSQTLASKTLKLTRFKATEEGNRIFSTVAGRHWANDMSAQLLKNPANNAILQTLERMGLNSKEIYQRALAKKSPLTPNDIKFIGQYISNKTQFTSRPLDLPLWWSSPEGKVWSQFKNFSYNQGIFLYDTIVNNGILKGNFAPLLYFMTVYPLTGEVIGDIRSLLSGRKRTQVVDIPSALQRYIENISWTSSFGAAVDALSAVNNGETALLEFLAGPTGVTAVREVTSLADIPTKGPMPFLKTTLRNVPVVGSPIANMLNKKPPKETQF